jgi:hypothetical protein
MFKFAGTSGGSRTVGSRENSRSHAGTDPADAQEYPENDRREKKVRFFLYYCGLRSELDCRIASPKISVADPGCLSRIRIFSIPDLCHRI